MDFEKINIILKEDRLRSLPIKLTFNQLASSFISLGGRYESYCPLFSNLIYGKRFGRLILDLRVTIVDMRRSALLIEKIVLNRGKLLYIDNVDSEAYHLNVGFFGRLKQYSFNALWKGGLLSNFKNLYFNMCKKIYLYGLAISKGVTVIKAKSNNKRLELELELAKRNFIKFYNGLFSMRRVPNVILVAGVERNLWAAFEASILRIPCITTNKGDLNFSGSLINIPGNTDNLFSLKVFIEFYLMTVLNGYIKEVSLFKNIKKQRKLNFYKKYLNSKKIPFKEKNNRYFSNSSKKNIFNKRFQFKNK